MEQKLRINPNDLQEVKCEKCESVLFREAVMIKKISALLSPNGQESFIPVPTFACISCNHVNSAFKQEH
jgi:hypothetical protein